MCWTGEKIGWAFIKFHLLTHVLHPLLEYGWLENISCQAGEHCLKFYIKLIKKLTNNKEDWQKQVFKIHQRENNLGTILSEIGMCPAFVLIIL